MNYQEYLPAENLRRYVECFWMHRSGCVSSDQAQRIYPDGCMDIIFNFAEPIWSPDTRTANTAHAFVVGNMTRFSSARAIGKLDLLGIRFHPGGIFSFLKMPLQEITDSFVDLAVISRVLAAELVERLYEQKSDLLRIQLLEQTLLSRLRDDGAFDELSQFSVNRLVTSHGNVSVCRVASECGLSRRQLERRFNATVGIPPKLLTQIVRFRKTQTIIGESTQKDLTVIAYECGYFDQAHMTREFKRFAGLTPTSFRRSL
jgi:AraC-like DNA-binding protein